MIYTICKLLLALVVKLYVQISDTHDQIGYIYINRAKDWLRFWDDEKALKAAILTCIYHFFAYF